MTQYATEHYDIQALVAGLGVEYSHGRFLLFEIPRPAADGCAFLERLLEKTTTVADLENSPPVIVNVALSYPGLQAIGVNVRSLSTFPIEFREGMAARADANGDDGPNAPDTWESHWRLRKVDVLVAVYATDDPAVSDCATEIVAMAADCAVALVGCQPAAHLFRADADDGGRRRAHQIVEHFGFADGISNPPVKGLSDHVEDGRINTEGRWEGLAAGEFLFGYGDEAGEVPIAPVPQTLARNGSFLVWRKLSQQVELFNRYIQDTAAWLSMSPDELAERMVGRGRDGRSLALNAHRLRGFSYSIDSLGQGCPMGAHVRRANPRDHFGYGTALVDRHRILRRGMTYGSRWPPTDGALWNEDRGLVFIAINISTSRQFEFVQRQWLNFGNDFDQGNQRDPLVGNHDKAGGTFVMPGDPDRRTRVCTGLQPFVLTRGGDYFFLPGKRALEKMAASAFVRPPAEGRASPP